MHFKRSEMWKINVFLVTITKLSHRNVKNKQLNELNDLFFFSLFFLKEFCLKLVSKVVLKISFDGDLCKLPLFLFPVKLSNLCEIQYCKPGQVSNGLPMSCEGIT